MALICNPAGPKRLIFPLVLLTFLVLLPLTAMALPPPLNPTELLERSDLVIEGRVKKVWLYSQWLTFLQEGGLGSGGKTLLKQAPVTNEGLLRLIRNFPCKSSVPVEVAVDSFHLAEVQVEKVLKGQPERVIFIPFVSFHFLTDRRLEGPWTERQYHVGEHLKMFLRQTGPFFESTWWNAVRPLGK